MNTALIFIHAMSPIHCGTGQAIGGVDLPIVREKPTNLPLVPGSSLKGVLRSNDTGEKRMHTAVFGPDTENASDHAGGVQFSDANLIFLPVRSLYGTFAWVTSPFMMRRFLRDAGEAGLSVSAKVSPPTVGQAYITGEALTDGADPGKAKVVFEDLDFRGKLDNSFAGLAREVGGLLHPKNSEEQDLFFNRVCMVHDDVMALLLQTSMSITTRIRMDADTGTVAKGALWTEEALPVESILCGLLAATPVRQRNGDVPKAAELLSHVRALFERSIQLGGGATVGRGLCRVSMTTAKGEK